MPACVSARCVCSLPCQNNVSASRADAHAAHRVMELDLERTVKGVFLRVVALVDGKLPLSHGDGDGFVQLVCHLRGSLAVVLCFF